MNEQKIAKFNKIFPWYSGLSGDLLFWVAIDTLFLTVVKNFNASQIVSLTTISLIVCIMLQNRSEDYIKVKTKSNTIYATVTMIISFIASVMFNINNYLPMIFCILFCLICFILSFDIIDFSNYIKQKIYNQIKKEKK